VAESRIRTGIKGISEGWTLAEFSQYAGDEVQRLANKMLREQSYIPLERDDLVQVILFTIWDRCVHWDGRGSVEGYVMFRVKTRLIREMMWAKGLARDSHNQWVGAALIPIGEDEFFEAEVFEGATPDELIDASRSVNEFVELACKTERETVLVMTGLKEGTAYGAKLLFEQEGIEALGLVRDIGWIQKAIARALKRAKKEYYGNEENDEANGEEDRRRCEVERCEGRHRSQCLSIGKEGCEQDVGPSNVVARGNRTRSRRRRSQPSALVSCCDAG
jgi:DNA-directed RNA polymerase specialized sigma24 family protein